MHNFLSNVANRETNQYYRKQPPCQGGNKYQALLMIRNYTQHLSKFLCSFETYHRVNEENVTVFDM